MWRGRGGISRRARGGRGRTYLAQRPSRSLRASASAARHAGRCGMRRSGPHEPPHSPPFRLRPARKRHIRATALAPPHYTAGRMTRWPLVALLLLLALPGWAAPVYDGPVIAITDGDTLRVRYQDGELKVRLAEIDTPERDQPYGSRARQALSALCFGKQARVVEQTRGRYGRIVGRVYCEGIDANAEMIRQGAAWVYRPYARDQSLCRLEKEARQAKRGLWALPEAQRL